MEIMKLKCLGEQEHNPKFQERDAWFPDSPFEVKLKHEKEFQVKEIK